jgi:hypothetical protein
MPSTTSASVKHRCPICEMRFPDRRALRSHTGSKSPISAIAHPCVLCSRQFCSEKALLQHQSSPSHDTMFKCDTCKRPFRSNRGLGDHQRAVGHAVTGPAVASASTIGSEGRMSGGMGAAGSSKINSLTGQMMNVQLDEDWALCDKDCGWCGHCAESYVY